jgi:transcription initiation factor TFIID subunit TAF12
METALYKFVPRQMIVRRNETLISVFHCIATIDEEARNIPQTHPVRTVLLVGFSFALR